MFVYYVSAHFVFVWAFQENHIPEKFLQATEGTIFLGKFYILGEIILAEIKLKIEITVTFQLYL